MRAVLITGTSSGLGRSCVESFAARGWNVIATMRDPSRGPDFRTAGNVTVLRLDVTDPDSIATAVAAGVECYGGVDVLLNNAGCGISGVFEGLPAAAEEHAFAVNLFGPMRMIRAMLPHFRERGGGTIVNVTSAAGVFGLPATAIYTASKFALEGFSEALSYELLSQNIVVKIVEPGGMAGTRFVENAADWNRRCLPIGSYAGFAASTARMFAAMGSRPATPVRLVADRIFEAATDETDRLRYFPTEDVRPLLELRRGSSEEAFMRHMRAILPGRMDLTAQAKHDR